MSKRVIPEERIDIKDVLKSIGMENYSGPKILRYMNGRMAEDDYSLRWVTQVE